MDFESICLFVSCIKRALLSYHVMLIAFGMSASNGPWKNKPISYQPSKARVVDVDEA
jgi:hypothetical protein